MTRQEAWTLLNERMGDVIAAMQRVSGELGFA